MQVRRNAQIVVDGDRGPERQVAVIRDGIEQSNDLLEKVQDKLLPQAKAWQERVKQDGKGRFPGETDNNLSQLTNRKGTIANQQSEETVREIIAGKKQHLDEADRKSEEEILSVEVSALNFKSLPDVGILAYRFVDAPNETRSFGGQPVLRYVQGFKLDLDYLRNTLFPDLVARELDGLPGANVALLPETRRAEGSVAYEEPVPLLPGYRLVVTDSDPKWVAERVASLSRLLAGAAGLLLLVIAGGLGFTLRAVKQEMDLAGRKSDFVAAVTHELRTPLTGIKMYADMLKAGWVKDDSTRDEYVGFMAAETDRLARLVNRVLDFARTDRGRAEVAPVDLSEPVREVVRDFGPHVREKGFVLSVRHETERRAAANADAVKQILLNLLENAVKYAAGAGEKSIDVVVADAADRVALSVIDRGPGVPEAERDRIFTDFYRPGEEMTREAPGAGLGLALVRRLAESMGGAAEVRETPGGGATFRVTLPAV
jgi:signal transduction histidine kinase